MQKPTTSKSIQIILLVFLSFCGLLCDTTLFLVNLVTTKKPATDNSTTVTTVPETTNTPALETTPMTTSKPSALEKLTLKFKTVTFNVFGRATDTTIPSYWAATPETKAVASFDALYEFFPNDKGDFYYIPTKDTFYSLGPSSNESWSLVDEAYITKNLGTSSKTVNDSGSEPTTIKTTCTKGSQKIGSISFKVLDCREVYSTKVDGVNKEVMNLAVNKCLYSYATGKYLMFSEDTASIGSDKDSCTILKNLGFEKIDIVK